MPSTSAPTGSGYGYATTVHRSQGSTTARAHLFADGGGRELAYVAMSRARESTHAWVVADDVGQAADDLRRDWSARRTPTWALDTGLPGYAEAIRARRARSAHERQGPRGRHRPRPSEGRRRRRKGPSGRPVGLKSWPRPGPLSPEPSRTCRTSRAGDWRIFRAPKRAGPSPTWPVPRPL